MRGSFRLILQPWYQDCLIVFCLTNGLVPAEESEVIGARF
jgi:hypothetical protein